MTVTINESDLYSTIQAVQINERYREGIKENKK